VNTPSFTLGQIAERLGCAPPASGVDRVITGLAGLETATSSELSFLGSKKYLPQFAATSAAAVLVTRSVGVGAGSNGPAVLLVDNADLAMASVLAMFAPPVPRPGAGADASARIDPTARLAEGVAIGPFAVVGARCRIGPRSVLHAGVFLGDDVSIGEDCELFPHVIVRERITIGNRVVIHANSVLGTDGFGYRWDGKRHAKIPQIGTVIIEDDVEIGSCVCIDRAKFGVTRVGRGCKLDNLVQIAHNVILGPHCVIAGESAVAGSAQLGAGVMLGGHSAVRDHVKLGDGCIGIGRAGIARDFPPHTVVSGNPAVPNRQNLREQIAVRELPELIRQVQRLQEQVDRMEKK
jgi:UDP-3-O-[3-hydroxymyristoyl] glucosamine N-acyltransferase